jgi:Flp pilus assembly pilin Flp
MMELMRRSAQRIHDDSGQSLAEYSLILAFIALACVVALGLLGLAISGSYTSILPGF